MHEGGGVSASEVLLEGTRQLLSLCARGHAFEGVLEACSRAHAFEARCGMPVSAAPPHRRAARTRS